MQKIAKNTPYHARMIRGWYPELGEGLLRIGKELFYLEYYINYLKKSIPKFIENILKLGYAWIRCIKLVI